MDVSCRPVGILTISFVSLVLGLPTGNFLETSLARRVANTVPPGPFFEFKRNLPANDMERISFFSFPYRGMLEKKTVVNRGR